MERPDLTLYLGGTRSGKSARAEARALQTRGPVLYVATAEARPDDPSLLERIRRHRARRPEDWRTLERPLRLAEGIAAALARFPARAGRADEKGPSGKAASGSVSDTARSGAGGAHPPVAPVAPFAEDVGGPTILLDCVTLWVSNILFSLPDPEDATELEDAVRAEVEALLGLIERSGCRWLLVSGETGLGGIAPTRLGRAYDDGLGLANQLIAARARDVFLVVAGRTLRLEA